MDQREIRKRLTVRGGRVKKWGSRVSRRGRKGVGPRACSKTTFSSPRIGVIDAPATSSSCSTSTILPQASSSKASGSIRAGAIPRSERSTQPGPSNSVISTQATASIPLSPTVIGALSPSIRCSSATSTSTQPCLSKASGPAAAGGHLGALPSSSACSTSSMPFTFKAPYSTSANQGTAANPLSAPSTSRLSSVASPKSSKTPSYRSEIARAAEKLFHLPSTARESSSIIPQPCSSKNVSLAKAPPRPSSSKASGSKLTASSTYAPRLSSMNLTRIKNDLAELHENPLPGICVIQDENDMTLIHTLFVGLPNTPYDGGFFYFHVKCHENYPIRPPVVRFLTTGGGQVQFNPNLYRDGKVCLSVLGTWEGPGWSPLQTLSSLLLQIQSYVFNEKPYHNEPGFERERKKGDSEAYNELLKYETIRVAVIGMVANDFNLDIPKQLADRISLSFLKRYDSYEAKCVSKLPSIIVETRKLPFFRPFPGKNTIRMEYDVLLQRLRHLKRAVSENSQELQSTCSPL